ncbi:MAG: ATP-binding protein, partial [Ginsengibacter sp.]
SEKMASLGELTAGIAHEIQNPLNFVNNFSELNTELIDEMQQEIKKGNYEEINSIANDIRDNEQKINHHGKRAEAIVRGMLQHSRSNAGEKELTDINALADEYLRLSYHGFRTKNKSLSSGQPGFNATIKTDYDEKLDKVNVIPQDLGRVFLNLFNNAFYSISEKNKLAVKSTGNGESYEPMISVATSSVPSLTPGSKGVEIRVKDNGIGIPPELIDKIYQPFFTTKPSGEGTGLGLSLSYDLISKEHGGSIQVNTEPGEYAEFIIFLPV